MEMGKKKKSGGIRAEKGDRISSLSDELIHNILSRIDIQEAVQTCVLSRRWNRVWTTLPHLNFDSFEPYDYYVYENFVKEFLSNRNHSSEVSTISLYLRPFEPQLVNYPVNYAISHNVQEFLIVSTDFTIEFLPWAFPVLTTLHLRNCTSVPLMSWSLPNLTTLHLEYVIFQEDKILSFEGFVHLKNLTLKVLHDMEVLVITSLNLENLTISQESVEHSSCLFAVSAPNLSCLEYIGYCPLLLSAEDGFPCLEQVNLDIGIFQYQWKKYFEQNKQVIFQQLISLFQEIRGAKFLTLSFNTIQVLSWDPHFLEYQPSPFGNLECLKLDTRLFHRLESDIPCTSLNHIIIYLLGSSPLATIVIQDFGKIIRDYNPEMNMLRWTGSSYSVVEYEAMISSDDEYTSPSSESHAADEVDNSGEEIGDDLNEDADEKKAMFQDGHISDGGDEETIVQDLMGERVEDHVRQDPELKASVVQQKTIMEVSNRIPGQVNSTSNVHVNGTCSCSENDNLLLWEGHKVHSKFVDLLHYIKEKYPETFEHFDPQTEMIYTIGLNTLCTSVGAFFEVTRTNVTTSIITHYRGLFSDLERWGFNTTWLVNYLNSADETCSIDNCIDGAQGEVQELQARLDNAQKKVQELQALRVAKRAKMSEIGHFMTTLAAGYR